VPTCAQLIADTLSNLGVRHFFLLTGGDHEIFVELKHRGVRQILARSEDAAVYMADAYARLTQKPSWVYGQYGPGAANLAGSLAEPYWSSSPVVALASSMRRQHRHRFEYQELEQPPLFYAVTKWCGEAAMPDMLPQLLHAAVVRSLAGNPGPVYAGWANDMTAMEVQNAASPMPKDASSWRFPLHRPHAPAAVVADAAKLLAGARRPLVLAGNGVHNAGAEAALTAIVDKLGIPVVTSIAGKGSISERSPHAFGAVGRYSRNYANQSVKDADVIFAIGSRLGGLVTDSYRLIAPSCRLLHVDVEPHVLGHNFPADVAAQADACAFLEDLLAALGEVDLAANAAHRASWHAKLDGDRDAWRRRFAKAADPAPGPMRPEAVLRVLQETLPDDALVVADTGYAAAWVGALYEIPRAGRGLIRSDGSLGWAFPAGLGAKLAAPERPVVVVTGDGGFGYHVGELETAVRLCIPSVTIVLNNQSLALEYQLQEMLHGDAITEVDDYANVDHAAIARAFGAQGMRAETPEALRDALRGALRADGPVLIDAIIDKMAIAPVTRFDAIRKRDL